MHLLRRENNIIGASGCRLLFSAARGGEDIPTCSQCETMLVLVQYINQLLPDLESPYGSGDKFHQGHIGILQGTYTNSSDA